MVKKITGEQMSLAINDEAAKDFVEEVKYGIGSPTEVRAAAAFLESAANTKTLTKGVEGLQKKIDGQVSEIKGAKAALDEAAGKLDEAIQDIDMLRTEVVKEAEWFNELRADIVSEAITALREEALDSLSEEAKRIAKDSLAYYEGKFKTNATELKRIEEQQRASETRLVSAAQSILDLTRHPAKILPGKPIGAAIVILLLISSISSWMCLSTLRPIVEGNVVVSYAEGYKDALSQAESDLKKKENELEAYKEAFPEGLSEQRLHDLNEENAKL
jgi:hypothetical protein